MLPPLDVRHLAKSYHAGVAGCSASVRVLADVSLRVRAGEIVGVCGAAGAGKTTLLRCAAGALRPDRGEVRWFGVPATAEARRECGVAFVTPCPPNHAFLTARQALEHGGAANGITPAADTVALLDRAGLARVADRRLSALSRGALVRLAVARALREHPSLVLLDGAMDGLDSRWRIALALLLRTVATDGVACVVVARDYAVLRGTADRIVTLADGRVASERCAISSGGADAPWPVAASPDRSRRAASRVAEAAAPVVAAPAPPAVPPSVDSPSRAP